MFQNLHTKIVKLLLILPIVSRAFQLLGLHCILYSLYELYIMSFITFLDIANTCHLIVVSSLSVAELSIKDLRSPTFMKVLIN